MAGPSKHLSWEELACWNRLGRLWQEFPPGALVAAYPDRWRADRALDLARTFEAIRRGLGDHPIRINSAYRSASYNLAIGGAGASQHQEGRALDLVHAVIAPADFHHGILELFRRGKLPKLGGLGRYPGFVHVDVRPRTSGRLAQW